jgi:hypothetical protein
MNLTFLAALLSIGLFLAILLLLEMGRRIGVRRIAKDGEAAKLGFGAVDGAVFGLLGLLIAFAFSGAAVRFDSRRQLIVEETNAIGTAYLRLDLLPANAQPVLRDSFRRYLDSRIEIYRRLPDVSAAFEELARSNALQSEIWSQAVAASRTASSPAAAMLLLPALNQMIDITTSRTMASQMHPPEIVFIMLAVVALTSSLLAGYGMASSAVRSWIHLLGFALIMAITVNVILDMEYPRLGLIRIDAFDQALVDLRQSMK